MSTKNSSANNTLFSKERIETLIGGVKQANDATKPPVDSSESLSEIANIDIKCVRKRALSGQQVQADSLTKNTKTKLTVLSKGDNVIIPIPSIDRGPVDERNTKGVVMNVNEHGGYKIGTKVGQIKGYMSRNRVQFFANATLDVSEVPVSDMSVREIVSKILCIVNVRKEM
jgi:hypothetical protein